MSAASEKYDAIRILGEGSFGKVYLMRDKIRRALVCVKVIKIRNIPKKEREATRMEVDLLRRLNHPNIVRYMDSFLSRNGDSLCICMEYCDGGDLASQIKAAMPEGKQTLQEAIDALESQELKPLVSPSNASRIEEMKKLLD